MPGVSLAGKRVPGSNSRKNLVSGTFREYPSRGICFARGEIQAGRIALDFRKHGVLFMKNSLDAHLERHLGLNWFPFPLIEPGNRSLINPIRAVSHRKEIFCGASCLRKGNRAHEAHYRNATECNPKGKEGVCL